MKNAPAPQALLRRTISSLVAIAAVSAIFAVKALETGPRHEEEPATTQIAASAPVQNR